MVLADVWDNLDETVRRAVQSVAVESDRLDTNNFLGGLSLLSNVDRAAEIINDMQDETGLTLKVPSRLVEEVGDCPEHLTLSPTVREALNFFNLHRIRDISVAKVATRLLQLGGGPTVLALEKQGVLGDYIRRFQNLRDAD